MSSTKAKKPTMSELESELETLRAQKAAMLAKAEVEKKAA